MANASARDSGLPDFATLFEQASPAVVNISTLATPKARQPMYGTGGEEIPEIFRRYFGIPLPDENHSGRSQTMSLGSGFIISSDGYILTNNHVIDGADQIIVRLSDRSERSAELIGADKRSDLALLKIKSDRTLPVVRLGDSESVKPGQWVAAIGSPFNFEYSITKGIVSALNRSLPSDSYVPFVQTDVPINPGNSGGPLFNMNGEVIGINSQIFTRSGGFMGLSFAIPVDHVMWAVDQLKDKGYVTRGWLGVAIQDVDRDLAESFGLEKPMGALISQVVPGGPADKARLHPGDIIVSFNERAISSSGVLPMSVGVIRPGEKAKLEYIRNGKRKVVDVEVGQLPDESNAGSERKGDSIASDKNPLGVQVAELDENYRSKLRLDEDVQGLVVIGVNRGAGRSIGLRQGDVITDLNNRSVTTVAEFNKVVTKLPRNRSISMRVIRGGNPGYITFRLQE
ncbi:DegQ family serine endoprotease [Endozoicomonas sp. SCSIO W0465]|uniref:DegQ family serine endoprotease n=1 Tax=Endozoicomonas sp. SCSIO W0465 TaxID=2918516 RepID=UPI002074FF90|nr:DegQ family serine endoprotease [Endozoicomonas sp. SCSIO W0465]USE39064.1 DegQ family serine endoprotease [Endozoicomonas sp. SCSIO W0465]